MIQCNACELLVHCSWALVFSGVPEHRSLHFVCLHVMAQYKFPLQWLQSWVEPAEGFLFVHLVLCTQTDTFFVETPDEFTGQCLMLWVRTEHTNLGRQAEIQLLMCVRVLWNCLWDTALQLQSSSVGLNVPESPGNLETQGAGWYFLLLQRYLCNC